MKEWIKSMPYANNYTLKERPYYMFGSIIIHPVSQPENWVRGHSKEHWLDSGPRWWHKRIPNFPLPITHQMYKLHMKQLSLREIQKLAEGWESQGTKKKTCILKRVRKADTISCHKPHPQHSHIQLGWKPNSQILPEKRRVWTAHLVPQHQLPHLRD